MKRSVCKIDENIKRTGFLCLIPNQNITQLFPVLIKCNQVLNNLKKENEIKLQFEDGKIKELILDDSRRIYTNDNYDIIIIELKENEFDLNTYLKIDDDIYILYKNKQFKDIKKKQYILFIIQKEIK